MLITVFSKPFLSLNQSFSTSALLTLGAEQSHCVRSPRPVLVRYLEASLASAREMPVAPAPPGCDSQKVCLQTLPNVPYGQNCPRLESLV